MASQLLIDHLVRWARSAQALDARPPRQQPYRVSRSAAGHFLTFAAVASDGVSSFVNFSGFLSDFCCTVAG